MRGMKREGQQGKRKSSIVWSAPFPFDLATGYLDYDFEKALQVKIATFFTCHWLSYLPRTPTLRHFLKR